MNNLRSFALREEERNEETSQLWLLRHLRSLLNDVQDSILSSFILHQDCTPLRKFVNDSSRRRMLYICVKRKKTATKALGRLTENELIKNGNEQKAWRVQSPAIVKKAMGKKSVGKKKKSKVAQKVEEAVGVERTDKLEQNPNDRTDGSFSEISAQPDVTLSWSDTKLPANCNEFIFIITKTTLRVATFGFDQQFYVGKCLASSI
ncbi:unnamed protein product [Anisakis simplex]|uniref:Uncharacterized protein n=1 Tax=Anisakis simplex TaxID=6269 RepID=A0A0M3JSQ5_ANISI|nr:unnamed protein product [Anisakis simplex]